MVGRKKQGRLQSKKIKTVAFAFLERITSSSISSVLIAVNSCKALYPVAYCQSDEAPRLEVWSLALPCSRYSNRAHGLQVTT
jgi:hypothetical protein